MSPPKQPTQKQPCLRPCLQSLQLCPPEGTERRQSQTQTSSLPAITAPYLSHGALKSKMSTPLHVTAYSLLSLFPRPFGLECTAVYLSVTSHRSVCQIPAAVTERLHRTVLPEPVCQAVVPWSTGEAGRKKYLEKGGKCPSAKKPILSSPFLSVCIPLIEARGARAAASLSSCVKLLTITQSVTGIRAVWISKLKLNNRIIFLQTDNVH